MKALTTNQRGVLNLLRVYGNAYTVSEIAAALNRPTSSVRSALATLARHGAVEVKGSALTGGQTWGVKA